MSVGFGDGLPKEVAHIPEVLGGVVAEGSQRVHREWEHLEMLFTAEVDQAFDEREDELLITRANLVHHAGGVWGMDIVVGFNHRHQDADCFLIEVKDDL